MIPLINHDSREGEQGSVVVICPNSCFINSSLTITLGKTNIDQLPFQDPRLEVPTIYKAYFEAYVREYPRKIWPKILFISTNVPPF